MIQQQMQLDRALRAAELRPVEHVEAQVDDAGVQAAKRILEAKASLRTRRHGPRLAKHGVKHVLVYLPGPVPIRIAQRAGTR